MVHIKNKKSKQNQALPQNRILEPLTCRVLFEDFPEHPWPFYRGVSPRMCIGLCRKLNETIAILTRYVTYCHLCANLRLLAVKTKTSFVLWLAKFKCQRLVCKQWVLLLWCCTTCDQPLHVCSHWRTVFSISLVQIDCNGCEQQA